MKPGKPLAQGGHLARQRGRVVRPQRGRDQPRKRRRKFDLDGHVEDVWHTLQQYGELGRTDFKDDFRPVKL